VRKSLKTRLQVTSLPQRTGGGCRS
jgi:hypothetical protein